MKRLLIFILILSPLLSNAQVIAGIAPQGTHIVYPNDSISVSTMGNKDSIQIDIDCDSIVDFRLYLQKGAPPIDVPHSISVSPHDTLIELCYDTSAVPLWQFSYISWHELGDTISCVPGNNWDVPNEFRTQIAVMGGFDVFGPPSSTDTFFAIRKIVGGQPKTGWLNVTFYFPGNFMDPYLKLNSYTAFCSPNATSNFLTQNLFKLYPTIVENRILLNSKEEKFRVTILNQIGQLVYEKDFVSSGQHEISLSSFPAGHYLVRYESEKGSQVIRIQKN